MVAQRHDPTEALRLWGMVLNVRRCKEIEVLHPTDKAKDQKFYHFETFNIPVETYAFILKELELNIRREKHVTELQENGTKLLLELREWKAKYLALQDTYHELLSIHIDETLEREGAVEDETGV